MDFEMTCETLVRKIFQCSRFDDPLGRLANTDSWIGIHYEEFSEEHRCQAWAVLSRLQSEYLDSISGRDKLYKQSQIIEDNILQATTNKELYNSMLEINEIVEKLRLSEFPHIAYKNTNDKK